MRFKLTFSYLAVTLFLILNLPRLSAQPIPASDIPKRVMKSFDKKYSYAKHIQWSRSGLNYEAVINDTLTLRNIASTQEGTFENAIITDETRYTNTIASFDTIGTMLITRERMMPGDTIILPAAIKEYIKKKNITPSFWTRIEDYILPAFFYDGEANGKTYRFLDDGRFFKEW
jgi:hypothetical protein